MSQNGNALEIYAQSGIVMSQDTRSKIAIGGVISNGGGHISSSSSDILQLFVQQEDGREFDVEITNPGFSARAGNYVSVVYARNKEGGGNAMVAFVNHTTQRRMVFENAVKGLRGEAMVHLNGCLFIVVAMVVIMLAGTYLGDLKTILLYLCGLAIPITIINSYSRTKRKRSDLQNAFLRDINEYIDSILARDS